MVLLTLVLTYQNCGPGFEASSLSSEAGNDNGSGDNQVIVGDKSLFEQFSKVVENHCFACHGAPGSDFGGIVDFTGLTTQDSWLNHPLKLIKASDHLNSKMYYRLSFAKGKVSNQNNNMPFATPSTPVTMTEADADVIRDFINSIKTTVDEGAALKACYEKQQDLNAVEMRRLNQTEISNSMQDVFGLDGAYQNLPEALAGKFNNISRFQSLSELFFTRFVEETEAVVDRIADKFENQYSNCNSSVNCLANYTKPYAELLFRKRILNDEAEIYLRPIRALKDSNEASFTNKDLFKAGMMAILLSPRFLYVVREGNGSGRRRFSDFEIATRLSLTFYQSIPNRDLWNDASEGRITSSYQAVVDKLINSPLFKERFGTNFVNSWLDMDKLGAFDPSFGSYGVRTAEFNLVKESLEKSVQLSFQDAIDQEKSVNELVTGNTRFLDARLSNHFGINANLSGQQDFTKVDLPQNSPYAGTGFLTMAPAITTSMNDRESIVFRGVNILGAFTCQVTPPPPDDVEAEIKEENFPAGTSYREILSVHSNNARCASCHDKFDSYGFGLESFDGLGRYRNQDSFGNPIDASGAIEGSTFADHKGMANFIVKDNKFSSCMVQLGLTYATNQEIDINNNSDDLCTTLKIEDKSKDKNLSLKEILKQIVNSDYFLSWKDSNDGM